MALAIQTTLCIYSCSYLYFSFCFLYLATYKASIKQKQNQHKKNYEGYDGASGPARLPEELTEELFSVLITVDKITVAKKINLNKGNDMNFYLELYSILFYSIPSYSILACVRY